MQPPLVLLDVDGVINDIHGIGAKTSDWDTDIVKSHGFRVRIPSYMPGLIQSINRVAEIQWCTAWRNHANDEIAQHLGIGPLAVIDDGSTNRTPDWKAAAARHVVEQALKNGRPVLWIEDFYGNLPSEKMPPGTQFVDTTADRPGALLLPSDLPWWLSDLIQLELSDPLTLGDLLQGGELQ